MSRVIHFDLVADDPDRAIAFYQEVFGWKIVKWDGPVEYWLVTTGPNEKPGIDGGLARRSETSTGTVYTIGVDSVDDYVTKIQAAGGEILRAKSAIPGVGWLAYCKDTEGNEFGVMQDDPDAA
jgi:predicted enzyme related to lactoylglutathione lyase